MPVISFGADCSAFLKATDQVQQSARQVAATVLEAQRAVQGLTEKNYTRFVAESDRAAVAVEAVRTSTAKAATGASGALAQLGASAENMRRKLQQPVSAVGLQGISTSVESATAQLNAMGVKVSETDNAVGGLNNTITNGQKQALNALGESSTKLDTMTIKTRGLNDALASGYYDLDRSLNRCFENVLTGAEASFEGVRGAFVGMLADMATQAMSPITISVMGVMGGIFGGAGTAQAGQQAVGGGGFGIPNLPVSSLLPDSWTAGASSLMNWTLPGTYSSSVGLTSGSLSTSALQGATNLPAAGSFTGSAGGLGLGSALGYGALGSLGYGLFGGALGLPQNKYSSFTSGIGGALGSWGGSALAGSAMAAGSGMATGAAFGSVLPVVGTILGALGGGLLSSVFGGKKPKKPAVWGGAEIDLGNDSLYSPESYDFGATFDPKGYGRDAFEMYEDGNYAIAAKSRNKASNELSGTLNQMLREVAELGVQQADAVQDALPDSYAAAFKEQLSANPISAEWDLKGDDISEENFKNIATELQEKINASMLAAFQGMDFAEYTDKINIDQSSIEGLNKFTTALKLTEETIQSTAEIADPISQLEQEANAAKAQLTEWTKAMETAGVTTEYAGQLMTDYNEAMIGKFIGDIESSLNPLSQYAQAMKDANTAVDDRLAALKILGATEEQLAQVEGLRGQVLEQTLGPMKLAFEQDMNIREAQLSGNAALVSSIQTSVQHERELAEVRQKFGAESAEYTRVLGVQAGELEQLATQATESAAQLTAQMTALRLTFSQDMSLRYAQLGDDPNLVASTQLVIQQERELADIREKFGADSVQFAEMQYIHMAESAQAALKQQQSVAQAMLTELSNAAQSALTAASKAESDANKALSEAQSHLNAVRSAYLSALNKEASAIQSTMDAVHRAMEQLSRTRRDLLTNADTSPLGTAERYALTGAELERTFAKAMGGDAEAMAELATLSSKYLDVSKEANADFSKYRKDFERVQTMLAAVEAAGGMQNDTAQKQLDVLNAQIAAATEGTSQIVGSIKELEVAFLKAMGDYNAAQEVARKAQEAAEEARRKAEEAAQNVQQGGQNGGQNNDAQTPQTPPKTWQQDVLERKAAAMNRGETLNDHQTQGGWTADRVLQEIMRDVGNFAEWYTKYGRLEGFAKGGMASGWALVGEEGPELVNFSNPGRVYTADDTAEMLNPSQRFQSDFFRSELFQSSGLSVSRATAHNNSSMGNGNAELIAELLTEFRALRREVAELRSEQGRSQFSIADAALRTARKLEQFDFDGMPGMRNQ